MDKPHTFAEMLSQMRWALQEEIKANQKDKPRYSARCGKNFSTSGVFRYQFQCAARWEPPIDTPLHIEVANVDKTTLEVRGRVESFHLATITIVTEEPLPLHALDLVLLSENFFQLLKQLRGALDGRDETV